ncbi:Bro-N domain-containing protein [Bosea sp. (in: a-proteobacteria)]|uniref:BRO-N domain-containing protein n=1 Tax=Bosea sp. (in: a-proteobacteria) TaxID=1871050 RepID=UPI002617662E|nr:Bro-N domain-containing protein [Bosea sp. (in: a-proteobacteria)]MCO5092000.1 Bro-N domain-containing protein [Bosea sp. (in: a-proteobacteria)]
MSNITPFVFEDQLIRVVEIDGEPWFVAKDICAALGLAKHDTALERLDDDEKGSHSMGTLGGQQTVSIVSEAGAYRLTFTSRKPEAERFKRWLAHEVIPAIRRTGRYEVPGAPPPAAEGALAIGGEPLAVASYKLALVREARHLYGYARARALWEKLRLESVPGGPASADEEARACLAHLLSGKVRGGANLMLSEIEEALDGDIEARLSLLSCGIDAVPEIDGFTVASGAPHLMQIFADTQWRDRIYVRVLKRLPGARATGPQKFGEPMTRRGVFIPADNLDLGAAARRQVA